jgi:hypothetical protein
LLVKDVEQQNIGMFASMAQTNPALGAITNMDVLGRHIAQQFRLPEGAIMTPEEAAEKAKSQPQDPRVIAEQAKAEQTQAELQLQQARLAAEVADKERDDAFRREDRELDHEERLQEIALKRELAQLEVLKIRSAQEMKYLELAQNNELDIAKLQTQLQSEQLRKDTAEFQAGMKAQIDAQKIAANRSEQALKLNPLNKSRTGI